VPGAVVSPSLVMLPRSVSQSTLAGSPARGYEKI